MKKYLTGKTLTGMWKSNTASNKEAQKEKQASPRNTKLPQEESKQE